MNKIKKLPSILINKIAAGEVVERPASVVKELLENSLDAGASFVEVSIKDGGKTEIMVRDNGEGMSKDDAKLIVERHATSKINSEEDLNQINTFGFRGEALSSIAAVSKFKLQTRTKKALEGTQINIEGGEIKQVKACSHPKGSTISISELFYNMPARKKFLKSDYTEFKHIRDQIKAQSISCPKVGFVLKHNGKEIFNLPEKQTWQQRIQTALDFDLEDFVQLEIDAQYFSLKGYVGLPQTARKKRPTQYIFVNKRFLNNRTIAGAVYKAYEDLLPKGIHPPFIISLKIREDLIDVNVHPRKEEVKFVSPSSIFSNLFKHLQSKLSQETVETKILESTEKSFEPSKSFPSKKSTSSKPYSFSNQSFFKDKVQEPKSFENIYNFYKPVDEENPVIQITELYLLVPQKNGFLIYDQHAAEERILLEEFKKDFKQKSTNLQKLMFPEKIELKPAEIKILKEQKDVLEKLGFRIDFKKNQIKIKTVPTILKNKDLEKIIKEFIDDFIMEKETPTNTKKDNIDSQTLKALTYLACRSAVKQGDKLSSEKIKEIIEKLDDLGKKGLTCPHGRPTKIKISLKKLHKMFKRIE